MHREWSENQPIYRQLREIIIAMILEEVLKEGDALPSVRQVATEYRVNPITVLKSYQQLVIEDIVEKRRGVGMFVRNGARAVVLRAERDKFLNEEWPRIQQAIARLGLDARDLLDPSPARAARAKAKGVR